MNKLSLNKFFKRLAIIHITLIFALLIFVLVSLFLRTEGYVRADFEAHDFLRFVVPVTVFGALYGGNVLYKRRLMIAGKKSTLAKKLVVYRKGAIFRYIFWFISSLVSIVGYLLTGIWLYLGFAALIIIVFIANFPSIGRAKQELNL